MRKRADVGAVIVAGGSSQRMEGVDKLFAMLGDLPVLAHTLLAFEKCRAIGEITVVVRADSIPDVNVLAGELGLRKLNHIVAGGANRQDSVSKGVAEVDKSLPFIAIHDGARPLITPGLIEDVAADARQYGAATAAVPVSDTIKQTDGDDFIQKTVPRINLRACQTPQIFTAEDYRAALARAQKSGRNYTDDCQLFESSGKPVYLTQGSFSNIKITTPADIFVAEALLDWQES